ncbi:MAG: hypothetical protein IJ757_02310 [Clostridiales bacterium]|nr:hypothetical protein [Clostridiales bacterium]
MNEKKPLSPLGILSLVLSILGCTALIGLILAIIDLKKDDGKNKLLSKISLGICGIWLIIAICANIGRRNRENVETVETTINIASESSPEETFIEETETTASETNESLFIDIVAGELGEYGDIVVLGANTDFPDTNYCYVVPTGTYIVSNVGNYMAQVDVIRNELATDVDFDGNEYEYWVDSTPYLLDVGATEEITINEGYFIELEEPSHITLESVGTTNEQFLILPTSNQNNDTEEISVEEYIDYLNVTLNNAFGDNYTLSFEDGFITISVWQNGVAQGAALASSGNQTYIDGWNNLVDSMQTMADGIYSGLDYVNADDIHIIINVLNDENLDNTLLTFIDGVVTYSAI